MNAVGWGLCRGVDFNSFRTPRRMDKSGQEDCDAQTKLVKRVVANGQKLTICPEDPDA